MLKYFDLSDDSSMSRIGLRELLRKTSAAPSAFIAAFLSFNMQFDIPRNCYLCDCVVLYFLAFDSLRESWQA
jgi:hypothetical protein